MLAKLLMLIGFRPMVKIPGKDFFNLSPTEMASMIEAHINRGDEFFDADALYEFIEVPNPNPRLEEVREKIMRIDEESKSAVLWDGLSNAKGTDRLRALAMELRSSGE